MDVAVTVNKKILRGKIVKHLYTLYGQDVSCDNIRHSLRYFGFASDAEVKKALNYLCDELKNYARIKGCEENFWSRAAELTAIGVNLAEGDINDEGVILAE